MALAKKKQLKTKLPPVHDWRTSDKDEIDKRRLRAREESFGIVNLDPRFPIFSNFRVKSSSGINYIVELRDVRTRQVSCTCVDYRINGLGLCKHTEAVLALVRRRNRQAFESAREGNSDRIDLVVDNGANRLAIQGRVSELPGVVRSWFDDSGLLIGVSEEVALEAAEKLRAADYPHLRISQEIEPWMETRRQVADGKQLRHEYELKVQSGEWPPHETTVPLFPYQREGMLHLAAVGRALLADEMGLGKTIQAIAACALLKRLGRARRVLVVTPASLKTEWEEQIRKFTTLDYRLVYGARIARLKAYDSGPATSFFTIVNYEQMVADSLDVNERLVPDIVVLDEAQRIKNWSTKTAQAVKRLRSRHAFVLTGTPIENRIDEIHSLMDFLNPAVLGPLFRFNRDFYMLDDRGRPEGYKNLDQLHERIKPYMLRRLKAEVETELPDRTDRNHFVPLSPLQRQTYSDHELEVSRLASILRKRPLTKQESEKLQRELAMMRMICDTNYILDPEDRTCPKLGELERVLEDCVENDRKVIVFSEWERMLELVRELCDRCDIGYAWHTGRVPQQRRRAEINAFKRDPQCRVFLSTDSGATGLNLQNASVVINCDLPWNPAKLEQRIARAWRKNQTQPVTVVNLISEDTIEHRMLATLATKTAVASSVLDKPGEIKEIKLRTGKHEAAERLQQLLTPRNIVLPPKPIPGNKPGPGAPAVRQLPSDPALRFGHYAREQLKDALVRCEERYPAQGNHVVIVAVVEGDANRWRPALQAVHRENFGPGKSDPLAPSQLEVIDRQTDDTIQRLIEAGLISRTTRATRLLLPTDQAIPPVAKASYSEAQRRARIQLADRKLKKAKALAKVGCYAEARAAIRTAMHAIGRRLAMEHGLPEPSNWNGALTTELAPYWGKAFPFLSDWAKHPNKNWAKAIELLEQLVGGNN